MGPVGLPRQQLCLWLKLAGAQHCGGRGAAGGRCSRGEGLGHCQLSCILGNGVEMSLRYCETPLGWGTCQAHCQGRYNRSGKPGGGEVRCQGRDACHWDRPGGGRYVPTNHLQGDGNREAWGVLGGQRRERRCRWGGRRGAAGVGGIGAPVVRDPVLVRVGETRAQGAAGHGCHRPVPERARQQRPVAGVGRGLAAAGSGLAGVGGGRRAGAVLPARGGLRLGGPVSDRG